MAKTLITMVFEDDKKEGLVYKAGKAVFADGMRSCERTLYKDTRDGKEYVKLNGNVQPFRRAKHQNSNECVYGYIW